MGTDGDAITEEQAGEELIKAASNNNVDSLDPPGIEILVSSGAPVNYQVSKTIASVICTHRIHQFKTMLLMKQQMAMLQAHDAKC